MYGLLVVLLFAADGKPVNPADIAKDSINNYLRPSNQNKMMLIVPPLGAELGALVSLPVAWFAGWTATGFKTETEFSSCGMPTGCNCVINYPVFWSVFGLGTLSSGIASGRMAVKWGERLDYNEARVAYLSNLAEREKRRVQRNFSHIWYLGAAGIEYGYNIGRLTIGRLGYVIAPVRLGIGVEGPSFFLEERIWRPPMFVFYFMPYCKPYRVGSMDFLNNAYLFFGLRPRSSDSTATKKLSFNAGLGFSAGSAVTLKLGAAQNLCDTLQTDLKPTVYAAIEIEWGSWFYTNKFKASRR